MNIYEKISAVMRDVRYLTKDDKVEFGTTKYRAISEEKVTMVVRESLIKNNIVIIPIEQSHRREGTISTVDVTYRIQNTENADDFICAVSSGTGADTQDKDVGKAMTYAYKYLLLRTFAIPTGEDPDKISSDELDKNIKTAMNLSEKKADPLYICEDCGQVIEGYMGTDNKFVEAYKHIAATKSKYGKTICVDCAVLKAAQAKKVAQQ